jgi:hypothetical protein
VLDLSNKQAEMLGTFILFYRDKSGNISEGIAKNGLEKYGIDKNTFENYKDYFLDNYFLRLNSFDKKLQEIPAQYYQITMLGVLAHMKWQLKLKKMLPLLDNDFFPLLHKHENELGKQYGEILDNVLKLTLERLDVHFETEYQHGKKIFFAGNLVESIRIPTKMMDIIIFRNYDELVMQKIPKSKKPRMSETFKNYNQKIDDNITERFTFLLFFNLLHVGISNREATNYIMRYHFEPDKKSSKQTMTLSKEDQNALDKIFSLLSKGGNTAFSIINDDEELHSLMKSSLSEITDMLGNRESIKAIYDKLT